MFPQDITHLSQQIIEGFTKENWMIATAESCTGGLIAAALTDVSGSSAVIDRGFVTYSNDAKTAMLNVPEDLIATKGAVSEEVAKAMAKGCLSRSKATVAVAVTGIAGPGGGTVQKPVGLVFIAVAKKGYEAYVTREVFTDMERHDVRMGTVKKALLMLLDQLAP